MKFRWIQRPVPTPINLSTVYEHTPLNAALGEYPRFIRPVRDERKTEWVKLYEDGTILRPGESCT
jgi:hypothetical protein